MLTDLLRFSDASLLLLRLMIAVIFGASGWNDVRDPHGRGQSLGMSPGATVGLGVAEIAGSVGVACGILTQAAAAGLLLLMIGALFKRIFVWHSEFWGQNGYGWHYDLMLAVMNLVVVCTGGGRYRLWP